ncbi:MAG: PKD domain-containing protein, partial [Niastella sp.]|uniref:PKD domain-containing protein n=1 Tax=Niastella sp. TaxID=1869183 RepID=UPI00389AAAE1
MPLNRTILAALVFSLSVASCKKDKDNQAPIVDAGQSLSTKTYYVDVTGSATDNDGKIITYLWSQVSGPAASKIASPSGTSTRIEFNKSGNYVFQLAATDDKGTVGVDTMTVDVEILNTLVMTMRNYSGEAVYPIVLLNGSDNSRNTFNTNPTSFGAVAWSSGGTTYYQREIIQFTGFGIGPVIVKSAHLYLYSDPQPTLGNKSDANSGSANALIIQQITNYWDVYSCTWQNPPVATTDDLVTIPLTNQPYLDLDIDVTAIVQKMVTSNTNYGFLLRLQNETPNNSRIFVS